MSKGISSSQAVLDLKDFELQSNINALTNIIYFPVWMPGSARPVKGQTKGFCKISTYATKNTRTSFHFPAFSEFPTGPQPGCDTVIPVSISSLQWRLWKAVAELPARAELSAHMCGMIVHLVKPWPLHVIARPQTAVTESLRILFADEIWADRGLTATSRRWIGWQKVEVGTNAKLCAITKLGFVGLLPFRPIPKFSAWNCLKAVSCVTLWACKQFQHPINRQVRPSPSVHLAKKYKGHEEGTPLSIKHIKTLFRENGCDFQTLGEEPARWCRPCNSSVQGRWNGSHQLCPAKVNSLLLLEVGRQERLDKKQSYRSSGWNGR